MSETGSQLQAAGPLAGLRVIDLTIAMAGPLATQRMADMGAEVIKIEGPNAPDFTRSSPIGGVILGGETTPYLAFNRNKKSLSVDLKDPASREIMDKLVQSADIFIQNFRPGVANRLSVDVDSVRSINPRIIYVSISGFDPDGELAGHPGQDLLLQAFSGMTWNAGQENGAPHPSPAYLVDALTSHLAVEGALAALLRRTRSGQGSHVEVTMVGAALEAQLQETTSFLSADAQPPRVKQPTASIWLGPPYGLYPAADGWVAIAQCDLHILAQALESAELSRLASIKTPDVAAQTEEYKSWRNAVCLEVQNCTQRYTVATLLKRLIGFRLWAQKVNSYRELFDSPEGARWVAEYDHSRAGHIRTIKPAIRFDGVDSAIFLAPPALGENSEAILCSIGVSPSEIARAKSKGMVR
jgi:crotonobetainyl-CoA:carnitine CoA-transferase CaiB-like acyl-CoA transferase